MAVGTAHSPLEAALDRCARLRQEGEVARATLLSARLALEHPWEARAWQERALCAAAAGQERWALYFRRRAGAGDLT